MTDAEDRTLLDEAAGRYARAHWSRYADLRGVLTDRTSPEEALRTVVADEGRAPMALIVLFPEPAEGQSEARVVVWMDGEVDSDMRPISEADMTRIGEVVDAASKPKLVVCPDCPHWMHLHTEGGHCGEGCH